MATPMESSEQFGPGPGISPSQGGQSTPDTQYKFTPEELRVLKQCNRDSFYQRSLPIGTALGIGTFFGVQSGYLKGHVRWGPTPKVIMAATIGYFIGKFSYQSKCAEKIMQLENSPLGEMLRKRKQQGRGGFSEGITLDPSFSTSVVPPLTGVAPQDVYSDIGPRHDLESDRPYIAGLNEARKPTPDSTFTEEDSLPEHPPSHTTTYEELRRKNREEYEQKRAKQYRGPSDDGPQSSTRTLQQERPSGNYKKEQNKYGDTWDD